MGRVSWRNHGQLERRIRRTCYYARGRPLDRLSLPLTEAVVEYFAKNAPFDDLDFEYASDVSKAGAVSPSVLIVAMIYLERMRMLNKDHFQTSDPADLFTSALLCAHKFLYDEAEAEFVYNDEWAVSCSRTLKHINKNEVKFLTALDWNTLIRESDFYPMLKSLETYVARKECQWRGFGMYSDLAVLASRMQEMWNEILLPGIVVVSLATLTYTATVVGLYTCALYNSITVPNRTTPLITQPYSALPASPAQQVQPSPYSWNVISKPPSMLDSQSQSVDAEMDQAQMETQIQLNRINASICWKETNEDQIELPPPWAAWLDPSKAFSVWSY